MSTSIRERLAQVLLATWSGLFVAFFGTNVTTYNEPVRVAAFWLYGLPVVALATYFVAFRPKHGDALLVGALGIFGVVAWVSTDRQASLETVGLVAAYASTFLIASRMTNAERRSAVAVGVTLAATVWLLTLATVWTIDRGEWIALGGGVPPTIARGAHMWLGTDIVAVLLILSIPFLPWIRQRVLRRTLTFATLVAAVPIVPFSDARTAWIAAVIGCVVFVSLSPTLRARIWPRYRVLAVTGGVLLAGAMGFLIITGRIGTLSGRTYIWETALATFGSSPLVGTGPGTFSWARLASAPPLLDRYPVFHAHNIVLQTLSDGGILLLAGLGLACIGWLVRVGPRVTALDGRSRLGVAALAALTVILMLDESTQIPAIAALGLVLAGWTAADADALRPRDAPRGAGRFVLAGAMIAAVVVALQPAASASEARSAASDARSAAVVGAWQDSYDSFSAARDRWPTHAAYELGLGLAATHLGRLDDAVEHYSAAASLSPGDPRPLGALAHLTDNPEDSRRLLEQASRLGARDPQYAYRLAINLVRDGRPDDAAVEFARAAMLDPQLLVTLGDEGDPTMLSRVLDELPAVLAGEATLAAIDAQSVLAQANIARGRMEPDDPPAYKALAELRSGDLDAARVAVEQAQRTLPYEPQTQDVGVAVAEAACDHNEAERLRALADIAAGGFRALYRMGEVIEIRDDIYREQGLGDYQPAGVDRPKVWPYDWPLAFVAGIGCNADIAGE